MSIEISKAKASERVRQLAKLYSERIITESFFISGIAEVVTPDTIESVMALIPNQLMPAVTKWIKTLRESDSHKIIFWPLPKATVLSFKEWLKQQEPLTCEKEEQQKD